MTKSPQLKIEKRKILGRKVRRLRQEGLLPANIYGNKVESLSVQVNRVQFEKLFRKTGETDVINLAVKGEKEPRPALVSEVQLDPVTDHPIHVDFMQVDLAEKVKVAVPLKFMGESQAVKAGNVFLELMNEIEVEALPADFPNDIKVDISGLEEVGAEIKVKDLKVPSKVKILADAEELVAKIEASAVEKEPEAPVEVEAVEGEEEKAKEKEEAVPEAKEERSSEAKKKPAEKK